MTSARWVAVGALLLGGALAGCGGDEDASPPLDLSVSMTQPIPFRDTPKVLLRVDNDGPDPVHITAAGLDWVAYGGRTMIAKDYDLQPGERIDLTFTLPAEQCDSDEGQPEVVVVTDRGSASKELHSYGEEFIRDLWATRCFSAKLEATADVSYAAGWRVQPSRVSGDLVVERKDGAEPMEFRSSLGSVLYQVELPRPVAIPPDDATGRVPFEVLPNGRCDEHAIGQATAPFSFKYDIAVAETHRVVVLSPPIALQDDIAAMLLEHCRREGGITFN